MMSKLTHTAMSNDSGMVPRIVRARSELWLIAIAALWLVGAIVSTVIGVAARWPAAAARPGGVAHIGTDWMSKGTVLSPPLFVMVALAVALAVLVFVSRRGWRIAAVILSIVVGVTGLSAFLEVIAPPSPEVPHAAQYFGFIGVGFSLALLIVAVIALVGLLRARTSTPSAVAVA